MASRNGFANQNVTITGSKIGQVLLLYFSHRGTATLFLFFHDADGNMARPKIRACVLIIREDDSIDLFIGETKRGKVQVKGTCHRWATRYYTLACLVAFVRL